MQFSVLVDIRLRGGISDPAGATIERVLPVLGYEGIADVTVGKTIRFTIDAVDAEAAVVGLTLHLTLTVEGHDSDAR